MTKPLRVAVAGMGTMGRLYAGWMQQGRVPGAVFSAAYDPASDCAARLQEGFPQAKFFSQSSELFHSGLADAVIIASTTDSHCHSRHGFQHIAHISRVALGKLFFSENGNR